MKTDTEKLSDKNQTAPCNIDAVIKCSLDFKPIEEIKNIDFESPEFIRQMEQIEKESEEILKSKIPSRESMNQVFNI
jgi:hypothetical protein